MAKRESPASSSRRGVDRHTEKSKAAGRKNLAKGRETMIKRRAEAKANGAVPVGDRWAMLLDGRLSVRDLDDKEIKKMRPRGIDGGFSGRPRRLPSHIIQAFTDERIRRAKDGIAKVLPTAIEEAKRILEDPEAKDSDKIKVMAMVWDRNLGKNPETIRVQADDPFAAALREVVVDRDLADLAGEGIDLDADA
jgi:hypothetical protein